MTIYRLTGGPGSAHGAVHPAGNGSSGVERPIDPERLGQFSDRLADLLGALGSIEPRWAERLVSVIEELGREQTTLVFGGHFKSGKSTLLNALLGRDLLPVDSLPETGALCVLRSASSDRGWVFEGGDRRPVACDTEAIRREVALLDEVGQRRRGVEEIERLELDLAGVPIPSQQRWIDSPGINDTEVMNRCARRAAREGDLLIWILNSRQMLAEVEMAFLAEEIAYSGPASVVFVLNFFLTNDRLEEWHEGVERQLPFLLEKLAAFGTDLGFTAGQPPIVATVAGRALARSGDGAYGGSGLRRFLIGGGVGIPARCARARAHRSWRHLREIRDELAERVEREEKALAIARREVAARRAAVEADAKAFRRDIDRALGRLKSTWNKGVEKLAQKLADEVDKPLERDDTYTQRLNRGLGALAKKSRRHFSQAVSEAAARHRHEAPSGAVRKKIKGRLTPGARTVDVAQNEVESGGLIGGALAGAAAGTVVPLIGTFFGAVAGAAAGASMATEAAADKDVSETRVNIRREARSAGGMVDSEATTIRRMLLEHCRSKAEGLAPADASKLEYLRTVAQQLERAIEEARGLATVPLS